MADDLRKQIFDSLNLRETEDLAEIWQKNDRVEWTDLAFDLIGEILLQRLGTLPPQSEPIYEHGKQARNGVDEDAVSDKLEEMDDAPRLYNPKEVLKTSRWLNITAKIAVVAIIVANLPRLFEFHRTILQYLAGVPQWNFISWPIAIIVGGSLIALQCYLTFVALKALAYILKMLVQIEFQSRNREVNFPPSK